MGRLYSSLLRPLLFALPAEGAHSLAKLGLGLPLPWAKIAAPPSDPSLSIELAGLRLRSPLGLAAGFDKECRHLDTLASLGFGYVVGGTITLAPRAGNAKPRVGRYPARKSLVNAMGFPNPGADAVFDRLRTARLSPKLVSISGSTPDEVVALFERLEPAVDGVEFNVSCPNVRWGRDVDTEALLIEVMPRLRAHSKKPLFVKLPPYRGEREREAILSLVKIAAGAGVDAITASNTLPIAAPEMSIGTGGLSGRDIFPDTVRIVGDIYRETGGAVPINACGGIFSGEDAIACIRAGATTVQVYTGFIYEGPRVARNILDALLKAVPTHGTVKELIGLAA
jgi:dihydroorotate dehydrogenase